MPTFTIRGDAPNLQLIQEDLTPFLRGDFDLKASLVIEKSSERNLDIAEWGELVLSVGLGVASSAAWDAVKLAINRARRRGHVDVSGSPDLAIGGESHEPDSDMGDDVEGPQIAD